jgi:NAD-dependent dihydropyrimidine dehydrogenase PreA subunit
MKVCPENAIFRAGPNAGLALGTPYIEPRSVPCFLCTTLPCITACEDEALIWPRLVKADGTPSEGPQAVRMGLARVKPDQCVTWDTLDREARACRICVDRCPYPEQALRIAEPTGGDLVGHPVVDADFCTGCGICVFSCPAEPVAIVVDPR